MSEPLVSVGVASYNNSRYVIQTLDSIANQTYKNFELIIVDDCSTDDSVSKIKAWLSDNQLILGKLLINSENLGISKTFAKLIEHSNGTFITTIGSDDNFLPNKIENFINAFKNLPLDYAVVFSDAFLIKEDGSRRYGRFIQGCCFFEDVPTGDIYEDLLNNNFIPAMATMIRKNAIEAIGGIDISLSYEDYDLWLRLSKKFKFHYVHVESVEYRLHSNSTSATKNYWLSSEFDIFFKHIDNPKAIFRLLGIIEFAYSTKRYDLAKTWIKKFEASTGQKCKLKFFVLMRIPPFYYKALKAIKNHFLPKKKN